jgi:hypothetical protein
VYMPRLRDVEASMLTSPVTFDHAPAVGRVGSFHQD